MNIQPTNSVSMCGNPNKGWKAFKNKVVQKVIDVAPSHTAKEGEKSIDKWNRWDNFISKPMQNRGILGVTALLTQPAIDAANFKVDKETRKMSVLNRIAVILAGTTVGMFVVRGPVYKAIEKMTNIEGNSKYSKALLPKKFINEIKNNKKYLDNYRSALAMGIILGVNCFTNFLFDAPLTIFLTNSFKKLVDKNPEKKNPKEVKNEQ